MIIHPKQLLWIDAFAALLSAVVVLSLKGWFALLFNLPPALLTTLGTIALIYAPYSFYLATRTNIQVNLVKVLAIANAVYGLICFGLLIYHFQSASLWGVVYFTIDVICVSLLAYLEYDKIVRPVLA